MGISQNNIKHQVLNRKRKHFTSKNDNAMIFGKSIQLVTESGHYTIPIS